MGSDFNFDYHVSSSRERKRAHNYREGARRERDGRDGVAAPPRRVPSLKSGHGFFDGGNDGGVRGAVLLRLRARQPAAGGHRHGLIYAAIWALIGFTLNYMMGMVMMPSSFLIAGGAVAMA